MAEELGVGTTAVSNAVVRGYFPPSWWLVCNALASEAGARCPEHLFKMKVPRNPSYVDRAGDFQGSTATDSKAPLAEA